MTRFEDGPAKGQVLMIQRAPVFLRVTEKDGKWDALDRLEDQPRAGEQVFTYFITGRAGMCFMDGTDKQGRRRGWSCVSANYRFYETQPSMAEMWDTTLWREWCAEQGKRMTQPSTAPGLPGSSLTQTP